MGKIQITKVLKSILTIGLVTTCSISLTGCYDIFSLDKNTNPPIYDSFDIKDVDPNAQEDSDTTNTSDNAGASLNNDKNSNSNSNSNSNNNNSNSSNNSSSNNSNTNR